MIYNVASLTQLGRHDRDKGVLLETIYATDKTPRSCLLNLLCLECSELNIYVNTLRVRVGIAFSISDIYFNIGPFLPEITSYIQTNVTSISY